MNKIQNTEMENYLQVKLSARSIVPIGVIYEDPSMATSWLKGKPLDRKITKYAVEKIAVALENAEAHSIEREMSE
jgi:CO dehydrogenase nickel-insertion accessory protein CooC1